MTCASDLPTAYDDMLECVEDILDANHRISVDELCTQLASHGGRQSIILEKGWRLGFCTKYGRSRGLIPLARRKKFRVYAWVLHTVRPRYNHPTAVREVLEPVFVVFKR